VLALRTSASGVWAGAGAGGGAGRGLTRFRASPSLPSRDSVGASPRRPRFAR
jgi:hypothetical protein